MLLAQLASCLGSVSNSGKEAGIVALFALLSQSKVLGSSAWVGRTKHCTPHARLA